jgi:phospholipid/cholesterol/gamma-HCH transport system substrate-binding protein
MTENANRETKAGIYLMLAVGLICTIIILVGEIPDLFGPTYVLTVEFADATGLLKGANVDLSGALIGKVITPPHTVPGTQKVAIEVRINETMRLHQDAQFTINNSGFFGDAFVEVLPRRSNLVEDVAPILKEGDVVEGIPSTNLSTLIASALPLVHRANHAAAQVDEMVTLLNTKVLTEESCQDLKHTVAALPTLGDNYAALVENADGLITNVKAGNGALGMLLYNQQVRNNLTEFIANYKEHGALFYSDDSAPKVPVDSRPSWRARP